MKGSSSRPNTPSEDKRSLAVALGRDVGPDVLLLGLITNGVAVVSLVGQQGRARLQVRQKVLRCGAVMGLTGCQSNPDRATFSIHQGMDLGGQAATGTSHATISIPFLPVAP